MLHRTADTVAFKFPGVLLLVEESDHIFYFPTIRW